MGQEATQTRNWLFNNCNFIQPKGPVVVINGNVNANIEFSGTNIKDSQIEYVNGANQNAVRLNK